MAENYLVLNLASYHTIEDEEFNERNAGLGFLTQGVEVGFYKNSYYDTSVYISQNKNFKVTENVQFRIQFGLATGYEYPVIPLLIPKVVVGNEVQVWVGVIPVDNTFTLQAAYKF